MTFREQLEKLEACKSALIWVKDKTIEQAWETCENSQWMFWILSQTDLDLVDPTCNMIERVLHLVPEDGQLACIWALSAAKRRASKDELKAASYAAYRAIPEPSLENMRDGSRSVVYAIAHITEYDIEHINAAVAAADAVRAAVASNYDKENLAQCNILRKYFTIDQVKEAFNKLVA